METEKTPVIICPLEVNTTSLKYSALVSKNYYYPAVFLIGVRAASRAAMILLHNLNCYCSSEILDFRNFLRQKPAKHKMDKN